MLTSLAQGAWLHDLDPVLLPISGAIAVRWYGLAYIGGFLIAWALTKALARRGLVGIRAEYVGDFILAAVVGVVVGGRLGYAIIYDPGLFIDFSGGVPFWGLLNITRGGMASHGGMVGLVIASVWIARRESTHALHITDVLASVATPGILLGRLANFVNGELLGKVVAGPGESAPGWSVRFPQELTDRPTPAQTDAVNGLVGRALSDDDYASIAHELVVGVREGDAQIRAFVEPMLHARHPSQIYQALAEGLLIFVVLWVIWRTPRRPGVITAWFLIVYGVGRISTEFIRLPDAGIGRTLGLSRGQWLSALMVIAGVALLVFIVQRAKRGAWAGSMGGWAQRKSGAAERDAASEREG